MKELLLLLGTCLLFSCSLKREKDVFETIAYPEMLSKVFKAHGTLELWKEQRTLSYDIVTDNGRELQTVDLQDRREYIVGSNFIMGNDGKQTWVKSDTSYNGNPVFYKNLMFYFYAMPFVLGDPGINYAKATPISFEGKDYPGIRITYNADVGISPEDEYFLHYNPETYQMEWLGYTVTYFSGEKSKKISWIRYNDWKKNNDILLPKELIWYNTEENKPVSFRSKRSFKNVILSIKPKPEAFYSIIEGAIVAK